CHAPKTANSVIGQRSKLRTQTVPPSEIMLNGSHRRQMPVWPRRSSQQFVTRNGGRASDRIATTKIRIRQLLPSAASQSAAMNPKVTASSVVKPLTRKLFLSRSQFILECASPLALFVRLRDARPEVLSCGRSAARNPKRQRTG